MAEHGRDLLRIITRHASRRGTFRSVKDLIGSITRFIDEWNDRCETVHELGDLSFDLRPGAPVLFLLGGNLSHPGCLEEVFVRVDRDRTARLRCGAVTRLGAVGAVVGEYLGSAKGVGYLIHQAEGTFDINTVFAGILVLTVFALLLDYVVTFAENRLLKWRPGQSETV